MCSPWETAQGHSAAACSNGITQSTIILTVKTGISAIQLLRYLMIVGIILLVSTQFSKQDENFSHKGLELYLCTSRGAREWKRRISGRKVSSVGAKILQLEKENWAKKLNLRAHYFHLTGFTRATQVWSKFFPTFTGASISSQGEPRRTGALWPSCH